MPSPPDDFADARLFSRILSASRDWETETGQRIHQKALREWIWFQWQVPRRQDGAVRNKYARNWQWSRAARDAYRAEPKARLVVEHREPMTLLIRELLDSDIEGPDELARLLNDRLVCCVITPEENRKIAKAGWARRRPPVDDPWARYTESDIDVGTFGPLD